MRITGLGERIWLLGNDRVYIDTNSLSPLFDTGVGVEWIALPMVRKL
jgi:hypothetical protein